MKKVEKCVDKKYMRQYTYKNRDFFHLIFTLIMQINRYEEKTGKIPLSQLKQWTQMKLFNKETQEETAQILNTEKPTEYTTQSMIDSIGIAFKVNKELIESIFWDAEIVLSEANRMRSVWPSPIAKFNVVCVSNWIEIDLWWFHFNKKHLRNILDQDWANAVITLMIAKYACQSTDQHIKKQAYEKLINNNYLSDLSDIETNNDKFITLALAYSKLSDDEKKSVLTELTKINADFKNGIDMFEYGQQWCVIWDTSNKWIRNQPLSNLKSQYQQYI